MTPPKVNGRPWDSFDGYLFDIDGTLIHCTDAVHYFAFCEALTTISGRSLTLEGVATQGNVDVGILRDAFALAGIPESRWRPQLPAILGGMGDFVAARTQDLCPNILPRVRDVLDHLRDKGASLGVATGNLRRIGELKLQRAGILDYFQIGGWSDEFECRPDVIRAAADKMRAATHPDAAICILGDTPADILAAHANGMPVIAITTGIYTPEQLLAENPELCLHSFADLF
jgi:phosphoglycolate phosphatase-like HAD superfamily hydrolase